MVAMVELAERQLLSSLVKRLPISALAPSFQCAWLGARCPGRCGSPARDGGDAPGRTGRAWRPRGRSAGWSSRRTGGGWRACARAGGVLAVAPRSRRRGRRSAHPQEHLDVARGPANTLRPDILVGIVPALSCISWWLDGQFVDVVYSQYYRAITYLCARPPRGVFDNKWYL